MIKFQCRTCGNKIAIGEQHAGKKGKCPKCQSINVIPLGNEEEISIHQAASYSVQEDTKQCPFCGETILAAAKKCKHCGEFLDGRQNNVSSAINAPHYTPQPAVQYGQSWSTGGFIGLFLGTIFIPLLGLIMGIIGLCSRGKRGQGAVLLSFSILFSLLYVLFLMPSLGRARTLAQRVQCSAQLSGIGEALALYQNDFDNQNPTPSQWNDLLIRYEDFVPEMFYCPSSQDEATEKSSYVLNPNADSYSDSDVVLVFETSTPGWNLHGGPELLSAKNHDGDGCFILFCGTNVMFVPKEEFYLLKWE